MTKPIELSIDLLNRLAKHAAGFDNADKVMPCDAWQSASRPLIKERYYTGGFTTSQN